MACATGEFLCLAVWIGGLVVIIGSVIPAVFNSFGMEPGGRFLTRVFDGYNQIVTVSILVLLGATTLRSRLAGALAPVSRTEMIVMSAMIGIAALIILVLGPQSVALQEEAFAVKDETAHKAAYDAFFTVHRIVRGLYVLNLGLGLALMVVKLKNILKYT